MKTLIVYYSYGGSTKKLAEALAKERNADLYEIKDQKRPGIVGAFMKCPAAMKMARAPIQPVLRSFDRYDRLILTAPVWAGHPAPAFNNVFDLLPSGKEVEVRMISGGGGTPKAKAKITAEIEAKGCTVVDYQDLFTNKK